MDTFTKYEYAQIEVANSFGFDKMNWLDRLIWVELNDKHLEELIDKADTPILYKQAITQYRALQSDPEAPCVVSLDATASGIEVLSCLLKDHKAAKLCNVVNTGKREDAYTVLYLKLKEQVPDLKLTRSETKKGIMPYFYGSVKTPMGIFEEHYEDFTNLMATEAPDLHYFISYSLNQWNPNVDNHSWIMPDNFHVSKDIMVKETRLFTFKGETRQINVKVKGTKKKGKSISADITHSVDSLVARELVRRCNYDKGRIKYVNRILYTQFEDTEPVNNNDNSMVQILWNHYELCGFLSARILNYINHTNIHLVDREVIRQLIDSLPNEPFPVLPTHDCFKVPCEYGNDVRQQYNNLLSEIWDSYLITYITAQFLKDPLYTLKKENPGIKLTNYALS